MTRIVTPLVKLLQKVRSRRLPIIAFGCNVFAPALAGPIDDLRPGCWYEVPNSKLEAVFPHPTPPGTIGSRGVMDAYSGGAYDTLRDRLIVWGGGHENYSGNEVYVFDVNGLEWSRLDDPSDPVERDVARYPDGRPSSRETYDYIQYAENVDRFFSLGVGSAYGDQTSGNEVDAYDFNTLQWEAKRDKPQNGTMLGAFSAYDPIAGKLYHHGTLDSAGLLVYDPSRDAWEGPYGRYYAEHHMTAAIDPERRIMVATGGNGDEVAVWTLNNPRSPVIPDTSGDKILQAAEAPGFVYDSVIRKFVGWSGSASVYTLNPRNWRWTKVEPAPDNAVTPTEPNTRGTYGRFRYIPSKDAYVVVNHTNENVFFYKLTAADGSATSECAAKPDDGNNGNGGGNGNGGEGNGGGDGNGPGGGTDGGTDRPDRSDGGGAVDAVMLLGLLLMLVNRCRKQRA